MNLLKTGQRIFNNGDMANISHFGTITKVQPSKWGTNYLINPDPESERKPYWIPVCAFSDEYKGHGGTRLVTIESYNKWKRNQMAHLGITEFEEAI